MLIERFEVPKTMQEFRSILFELIGHACADWVDPDTQGHNEIELQFDSRLACKDLGELRLILMDTSEWLAYHEFLDRQTDQGDDDEPLSFNTAGVN